MTTKGIYTIARIVVFKDEPLATARHDLAVKSSNGEVWHNRKGLAWTDPFSEEVRDYNIDVAVEAAKAGFDEIQFDYVRFPDARCLMFSAQDLWRPLLAIAEAVGGDWTDRARRAAVELAGIQPEDNSLGVQLLARIQFMFEREQADRLSSETRFAAPADLVNRWPPRRGRSNWFG